MKITGLNLALRKADPRQIDEASRKLRDVLSSVGEVQVVSEHPGVITLDVNASSRREGKMKLDQIEQAMPGWRFSEEQAYALPETFTTRKLD